MRPIDSGVIVPAAATSRRWTAFAAFVLICWLTMGLAIAAKHCRGALAEGATSGVFARSASRSSAAMIGSVFVKCRCAFARSIGSYMRGRVVEYK